MVQRFRRSPRFGEYYVPISLVLDEAIGDLAERRICAVSIEARLMMEALLVETMRVRLEEARDRGVPEEGIDLIDHFREIVPQILSEASELPQYESRSAGKLVSLISVLEVVSRRWCRVWPFCR